MKELVIIEWVDSYSMGDRWEHLSNIDEPHVCICKSVGWILKETDDNIMLCPNWSNLQEKEDLRTCAGMWVIPKCCITKRTTLTEDYTAFSRTYLDNRTRAEAMSEIEGGQNI